MSVDGVLSAQDPFGDQPEPEPIVQEALPADEAELGRVAPEENDGDVAAGGRRDSIDVSAPHDANLAKALRQAETLLARGSWQRARELLLVTLDRADGAVVFRSDGSLGTVADEANRLLGKLPSDALDLYRREYGGAADRALAEAIEAGRRDKLEQVATLFRHTRAGRSALERLADIHFDRAEFGLAARRYRELLENEGKVGPRLRIKAAIAFHRSGRVDEARKLVDGVVDAEQAVLADIPATRDGLDLLRNSASSFPNAPAVLDWRMPFGDPTRSAVGVSGEPLLLRRWHRPLTNRTNIAEQADRVASDLRDAGRATIPAAIPLAIGNHIIARTFRGVGVYSAEDGRLLWETAEGASPERLLSAGSAVEPGARPFFRFRGQFAADPSLAGGGDQGEVANLLYRDSVNGFLSADAERLYVIEDSAGFARLPNARGWEIDDGDPLGLDRSSNRLSAYHLETGRLAWAGQGGVGGGLLGGALERPLAGYFFFGPPTPVGDDLYVIGEKDKEIRLLALDPVSGMPRWDRLIAYAQVGIDQDAVRRWWPAQIAVAEGIVVCPTTVGWLVGIDQASRSILWAVRYSPPQPGRMGDESGLTADLAALNSRWSPSAPIISRGKVVFAPSEEPRLVCLDAATGQLSWQKNKGGELYVAGVVGDLVVTVGTSAVTGLDLNTGESRWSVPLDAETGLPSGRAAMSAERIYLPLRGDMLKVIDLDDGEVVADFALPPGDGSLGTLLLHEGMLLSYAADGLTVFEERVGLTRLVEDRLRKDSADVGARLRQADLLAADGDFAAAAEMLDRIDVTQSPAEQKAELRRLRSRILSELIRNGGDEDDVDRRLQELSRLVETPEERSAVRRLEADRAFAIGDDARALAACLALVDVEPLDQVLLEDQGLLTVRLDAWLAGRLGELWKHTDEPTRWAITAAVEERFEAVDDDAERDRLAYVFGFHPAAAQIVRELALKEVAAGRLAEAEMRLIPLARGVEPARVQTRQDLAKAAESLGLSSDASFWLTGLDEPDSAAASPPERDIQEDGTRELRLNEPSSNDWGNFRLTVVRSGNYQPNDSTTDVVPESVAGLLPFFRDRQLQLVGQQDRLAVSGAGGTGLERLISLKVGNRLSAGPIAIADGHLLFLSNRNVSQLVSPVEGRVVWSVPTEGDAVGSYAAEVAPQPMRPAGSFPSSGGVIARARSGGSMPAANASYVVLRGRRDVTVLDSSTGKVRWTRQGVPRGATVIGTESSLYVLPSDRDQAFALRIADGHRIERPEAIRQLPCAVAIVGDRLLTVAAEQSLSLFGLRLGRTVVTLRDPETGKAAWSRAYPQDTLFDINGGRLCVLEPDGALSALDSLTGKPSLIGNVPRDVLGRRNEAYLFRDSRTTYVIVNSGRGAGRYYPGEVSAVAVHGEVFAFDPVGGTLRWRHPVTNRRLLCSSFEHMPVLLFTDVEMTEKAARPMWCVDLLALDKRTGAPVLDESVYSQSNPFLRSLAVRPDRRSIELGVYPAKIRLQAVPNEEVGEAAGEPE